TDTKTDTIPDKLFTKVENEAEFPGGRPAWIKYIVTKITAVQDSLTEKDFGTCLVKFIVNKDGSITNVEATTMKDTRLAMVAVNAIKTGPKWIPAMQNNNTVASYRLQPVTLTDPGKK
ncbi:MAG: energy transducer TonB, partial [Ginsengibacter sp.]